MTGWEAPPKKRPFRGSKRFIRIESTYYYDPFGRRLWKEVAGVRTYFVYADEGLVAEVDAAGNVTKSYGNKPGSTWTTDPLFMKIGGQYYFYQNDHLGTPQKLTAINGAVVWSAKYSSFGEAEVDLSSSVTNNLRFPGQYFDEETMLHYNWHRYYDCSIGKYLSSDPIGLLGGINYYIYVKDNPIRYIDPFGLATLPIPEGFRNDPRVQADFDQLTDEVQDATIIAWLDEKEKEWKKRRGGGFDSWKDMSRALSATQGMPPGLDCMNDEWGKCMLGCMTGWTESELQQIKNAPRAAGTFGKYAAKVFKVSSTALKIGIKSLNYYGIAITIYDLDRCSKKCSKYCEQCEPEN